MKTNKLLTPILLLFFISCQLDQKSDQVPLNEYSVEYDVFVESGDTLAHNVRIYNADSVCIFSDNKNVFLARECPLSCIMPSGDSVTYLLLRISDPISQRTLLVLQYDHIHPLKQSLLCADFIADIDNDGLFEIVGQQWVDAYGETTDSAYYAPIEVYKLGTETLVYDDLHSIALTQGVYGCYLREPYNHDTVLPYNADFLTDYME